MCVCVCCVIFDSKTARKQDDEEKEKHLTIVTEKIYTAYKYILRRRKKNRKNWFSLLHFKNWTYILCACLVFAVCDTCIITSLFAVVNVFQVGYALCFFYVLYEVHIHTYMFSAHIKYTPTTWIWIGFHSFNTRIAWARAWWECGE